MPQQYDFTNRIRFGEILFSEPVGLIDEIL